jgi:hypothetical protein
MYCKIHPSVETNVSCSNCGDPICPDCMVFTPVGAKCPGCASMPKSALIRVKPERLLLTALAGPAAAAAGGYVFGLLISMITFFAFIVAFGLGMGVGEVVSWSSGRYHGTRLAAWAAICGAFGILFPFLLVGFTSYGISADAIRYTLSFGGFWKLLWVAAAAYGAWQRNA